MPETVSLLAVTPENFSDEVLSQIINALALKGDEPIAQLAAFIKSFRQFRAPLETDIALIWKDSYIESLCHALYAALMDEGTIDGLGRLDLGRLRNRALEQSSNSK